MTTITIQHAEKFAEYFINNREDKKYIENTNVVFFENDEFLIKISSKNVHTTKLLFDADFKKMNKVVDNGFIFAITGLKKILKVPAKLAIMERYLRNPVVRFYKNDENIHSIIIGEYALSYENDTRYIVSIELASELGSYEPVYDDLLTGLRYKKTEKHIQKQLSLVRKQSIGAIPTELTEFKNTLQQYNVQNNENR